MKAPAHTAIRILYVEDNDIVRELTCELLMQENREISAFATAEEALLAFQSKEFDLVITDVSLPKMSGLDFVREVRRVRPGMAVIVATGYPLHSALKEWGDNVASISKPFEGRQIDALIAQLMKTQGV